MPLNGKSHLIRSSPVRFIVRPQPYIDESWPGYLLRFAKANGLQGILPIANVLGVRAFDLIVGDPLPIMKQLSVIGFEDAADNVPLNTHAHRVSRRLLARVCPGCLLTDRYISIYWDYPAYATCPKHDSLLTDTCPACSQPLTYSRPGIDRCRCGLDLKNAPMPDLPTWWGDFERIFKLSRRPQLPDSEAAITINLRGARPLLRLIRWIQTHRDIHRAKTAPRITYADTDAIARLIDEWPREFLSVVEAISAQYPAQASAIRTSLSRIESAEIDSALQQLALAQRTPRILIAQSQLQTGDLSMKDIRRFTKLNHYSVRQLVHSPLIKGARQEVDSRGNAKVYIPLSEGRLLKKFFYDSFGVQEISTRLMCSTQHVRALVKMRLLNGLRLTKYGTSYRFKLDDVDRFIANLMVKVSEDSSLSSAFIVLTDVPAFNRKSNVNPQWRDLIKGILSGLIPLYSVGTAANGLSALAIRKVHLPPVKHRVRRRGGANMR